MGKSKNIKRTIYLAPELNGSFSRTEQQRVRRMQTLSERLAHMDKLGLIPASEKREMRKYLKGVGLSLLVMLFYVTSFIALIL